MCVPRGRAGFARYNTQEGDPFCPRKVAVPNCRGSVYFCSMAHEHHDHHEPEQNEIGGPVVFALFLFAIVVVAIGMMAS